MIDVRDTCAWSLQIHSKGLKLGIYGGMCHLFTVSKKCNFVSAHAIQYQSKQEYHILSSIMSVIMSSLLLEWSIAILKFISPMVMFLKALVARTLFTVPLCK